MTESNMKVTYTENPYRMDKCEKEYELDHYISKIVRYPSGIENKIEAFGRALEILIFNACIEDPELISEFAASFGLHHSDHKLVEDGSEKQESPPDKYTIAYQEDFHPWHNESGWITQVWETKSHEASQRLAKWAQNHGWSIWLLTNTGEPGLVVYRAQE